MNRHLTKDIASNISFIGFKPAAEAKVQNLYASSIFEKNDEVTPEAVHPRESAVALKDSLLEFTFRHESVTVVTIDRAR